MRKRIFNIIQIGNKDDMASRMFDIGLTVVILLNILVTFMETFNELSDLFHESFTTSDVNAIANAARRLQDKGARNVLVSMGEDGAVLITEDGQVYSRPAPAGIVVNSVGSGDSMVAGFLAGYLSSHDYEQAFYMGLCTGSASAENIRERS